MNKLLFGFGLLAMPFIAQAVPLFESFMVFNSPRSDQNTVRILQAGISYAFDYSTTSSPCSQARMDRGIAPVATPLEVTKQGIKVKIPSVVSQSIHSFLSACGSKDIINGLKLQLEINNIENRNVMGSCTVFGYVGLSPETPKPVILPSLTIEVNNNAGRIHCHLNKVIKGASVKF